MQRVFVYGTLKRPYHNHRYYLANADSRYLGSCSTGPGYSLYVAGLPYLVKESGGKGAEGELYEVTDGIIKNLDFLEGHPDMYCRELIEVYDVNGKKTEAWCYLYPNVFEGEKRAKKVVNYVG